MPVASRTKGVDKISSSERKLRTGQSSTAARTGERSTKRRALTPISVTATMSSKGQVVIPAELRRKYRLEGGVTVVFREEDGHIVLEPDRFAAFFALRGTLPAEMEAELIEERRREREGEDRKH